MSLGVSVLQTGAFFMGGISMPTITKKQLEEYEQLRCDRDNGRLLTPDGLRFICEANNLDPEAIGKHILEVYGKFKAQKLI